MELILFITFKFYYDTNVLKVDTSVFGFGFISANSYLVLFYYLVLLGSWHVTSTIRKRKRKKNTQTNLLISILFIYFTIFYKKLYNHSCATETSILICSTYFILIKRNLLKHVLQS